MNDTVITIKTETNLKNEAMKLADELGFSLSSLVNAYLKSFVRTKTVNYSLADESHPTKFMIDSLKKSAKEVKTGKVSPAFSDAKSALKWLKSDKSKIRSKI